VCHILDIRNKKQAEQYFAILEANADRDVKVPILGIGSFRFVECGDELIGKIRENRHLMPLLLPHSNKALEEPISIGDKELMEEIGKLASSS
jgi:hypothetical protein